MVAMRRKEVDRREHHAPRARARRGTGGRTLRRPICLVRQTHLSDRQRTRALSACRCSGQSSCDVTGVGRTVPGSEESDERHAGRPQLSVCAPAINRGGCPALANVSGGHHAQRSDRGSSSPEASVRGPRALASRPSTCGAMRSTCTLPVRQTRASSIL
jgi:hypothetical protein